MLWRDRDELTLRGKGNTKETASDSCSGREPALLAPLASSSHGVLRLSSLMQKKAGSAELAASALL